jgi:hypothetical protein
VALSFVDDVAWVVEGEGVTWCIQKLQRWARLTTEWAEVNAVEFDIDKTEAILFPQKRNHQGSKVKIVVKVGENKVAFDKKPTRWLGIQLDRKLTFQHYHEVVMTKARRVQYRIRTITHQQKHFYNSEVSEVSAGFPRFLKLARAIITRMTFLEGC